LGGLGDWVFGEVFAEEDVDAAVGFFEGRDGGWFGEFGDAGFAFFGDANAALGEGEGVSAVDELGGEAEFGDGGVGAGGDFEKALFEVFAGALEEAEFFAFEAKGGGVLGAGFLGVGNVVGGVEAAKCGGTDAEV
jgi:hypothetical protein